MKRNKGITLITLVITIILLIILAGTVINLALGKNGIITKAKETRRLQAIAEAKEKIGTEILAAQVEAMERNEELEQAQVEDIISNYGVLQEDGDTIILNDNGYELSLLDIYNGTATTTGSYSELKAKVALLEQQLEDSSKSQSKASEELSDLKTTLAQTTVTEDKILKGYTAYKDGKLITGTMANYAERIVEAGVAASDGTNLYLTIPNAGYYNTNSKISTVNNNLKEYLIKDGVVQDGYTLLYSSDFTTPTKEDGYINTHGNRSVGFDNVDITNYKKLCIETFSPSSECGISGVFVDSAVSVTDDKAYTGSYIHRGSRIYDLSELTGYYNLGLSTGSSGDTYKIYIYNMWLE